MNSDNEVIITFTDDTLVVEVEGLRSELRGGEEIRTIKEAMARLAMGAMLEVFERKYGERKMAAALAQQQQGYVSRDPKGYASSANGSDGPLARGFLNY